MPSHRRVTLRVPSSHMVVLTPFTVTRTCHRQVLRERWVGDHCRRRPS